MEHTSTRKFLLTHSTWYHTDVPPKSMWKSVYEFSTPIKTYLDTFGRESGGPGGGSVGHELVTQHNFRTMYGGSTSWLRLKKEKSPIFQHMLLTIDAYILFHEVYKGGISTNCSSLNNLLDNQLHQSYLSK